MRVLVLLVRAHFSLLLCLLTSSLVAAEPLSEPGPAIIRGENDAAWQALFTALANKGAVSAMFTERRVYAVRKQPVELHGEMRLIPERGLSLHYGERTMIIDARGVLLRDRRGRTRVVPPDDRTPAANTLLLPVLRFDLPTLEKTFTIRGVRAGDAWRLDFIPRASKADDAGAVGAVVVHGSGDAINRIELRPKDGLRIEITLTGTKTGVTFTAEELQRFFR